MIQLADDKLVQIADYKMIQLADDKLIQFSDDKMIHLADVKLISRPMITASRIEFSAILSSVVKNIHKLLLPITAEADTIFL